VDVLDDHVDRGDGRAAGTGDGRVVAAADGDPTAAPGAEPLAEELDQLAL
jgi:hypothetical protein